MLFSAGDHIIISDDLYGGTYRIYVTQPNRIKRRCTNMAVKSTLVDSALTLKYKSGVDSNGKDIIKTKKFSNIKETATDENVYAVAAAFGPLMQYPVMQSLRTNENALTNV
jgi:O-acetylhomoserine/O-acetylserine sulfhydrylase-like pyridoxal-dependent enzyme